jgi:hypothetical protein
LLAPDRPSQDDEEERFLEFSDADSGGDNFVAIALFTNVTGLTDEDALAMNGDLLAA